jgi:hypothetical protein
MLKPGATLPFASDHVRRGNVHRPVKIDREGKVPYRTQTHLVGDYAKVLESQCDV